MRVMVLGAGLIGVATAFYLARHGNKVTVVERRSGPGEETSFANGGQISVGHTDPWPSPANLGNLLRWIGRADAPIRLRPRLDPALIEWCIRFLANCTPSRQRRNTERMLRVALFSHQKLRELGDETGITQNHDKAGILQIFRDPGAYAAALEQSARVSDLGCRRLPVSRDDCVALEPALAARAQELAGGIHCPDDETGDAYAFTRALAEQCVEMGVTFFYDTSVAAITHQDTRAINMVTTRGPLVADAYVLAMGSYTPLVSDTAEIRMPVYPAKGYSVTVPIADPGKAPRLGLISDERKIVMARLPGPGGDVLRIAGTAEFTGYDTSEDLGRAGLLLSQADYLFPGGLDTSAPEYWAGLRPQTPDSVPIMGRTRVENVFLNTGHGTLGWTMACGAGHIVADIVNGRRPGIDMTGLELRRFFGC